MSQTDLEQYRVIRSGRRTLELRLTADGEVEVRAPWRVPDAEIAAFVASRGDWLRRARQRLATRQAPLELALETGAVHPFRGKPLVLELDCAPRASVQLEDGRLLIRAPDLSAAPVAALLQGWYRQQARHYYDAEIDRHFPWFAERGHARPVLRVKQMRSRWGSLSARGYINLSLTLIQLPAECLEYVVVHELCHLEHMNHGPGFYRLMTARLPDWQPRRHLLNHLPRIALAF
ncbi:M48 family metallopeptidase [Isoalcanivorax beigongshangi]|uniref:M48 family metallopeptidase n=1 Tax=Isoalcanivorax beigongshangi TaxID=3238810 RepID=A0ABV4ACR6_9GAMM